MPEQTRVLYKMRHGLGDSVQCTIFIRHIKHYHPDWFVGVECRQGHEAIFRSVADAVYCDHKPWWWREQYPKPVELQFPHYKMGIHTVLPSTKATQAIHDFGMTPIYPDLYHYTCEISDAAKQTANEYHTRALNGK